MNRCEWCLSNELLMKYHDEEWGREVHDDNVHFEFLVLGSAQSGLSWMTILNKRENYRKQYSGFDFRKVALYDENKIEDMLKDTGIIRNRMKIACSINNAQRFIEVVNEFGSFDKYIWAFVDDKPVVNKYNTMGCIPAETDLSRKIAKDLKKRGFKFLGSVTVYAYLQTVGIVNDHVENCDFRFR